MRPEHPLRLLDNNTFEEMNPEREESRALQWRRSLNVINVSAKCVALDRHFYTNKIDFDREPDGDRGFGRSIAGQVDKRLRLSLEIDEEKMRDRLYFTKQSEDEEGVFTLDRIRGKIKLHLVEREACEGDSNTYGSGSYPGLAVAPSRFDAEHLDEGDCLSLELGVPREQIQEFYRIVHSDPQSTFEVRMALDSFEFEVDAALREWYHPQTLFIHGDAAKAALLTMTVKSEVNGGTLTQDKSEDDFDEGETEGLGQGYLYEPAPLPQPSPNYSPVLNSIKTALWVLTGVMIFAVFNFIGR